MTVGKGMYIWMLKDTEGGDMQKAAQVAVDAGIQHVMIKIADGQIAYNQRPLPGGGYADDILEPAVTAFQARGIEVWGWQYVYLANPVAEANVAVNRARKFGIKRFIYDVEGEAKNKPQAARDYLGITVPAFKEMGVTTALSTYRWPSYHMELPWEIWMKGSDIMMPQVYWMKATNAGAQLRRSVEEYASLQAKYGISDKPYIPTGAAFSEYGWTAQPGEIQDFLQTCVDLQLPAANFWVWSHARRLAEGQWDTIARFQWPGDPPTTGVVPLDRFIREHVYPWMIARGYTGPKPEGTTGLTFKDD